jgi:FAD-dependent urate hydroxylase
VREGAAVRSVVTNGAVRLELSDGERLEVDSLLLGTGYRFDLDRLGFFAPDVRRWIEVRDAWPLLDRCFRSTDPRIRFVGYAAEGRFGPVSRFVLGVPFTTRRVTGSLP